MCAVLPNVESGVKIAKALGVSVEYLATGERIVQDPKYTAINDIIRDLYQLSPAQLETVKRMIHGLVR